MQFDVKVTREKGRLRPRHIHHMGEPRRGELSVRQVSVPEWNRYSLVATLRTDTGEVLPPLHDVTIQYVDGDTVTLSGVERVPDGFGLGGAHEYAQSWIMREAGAVDLVKLQAEISEARRFREQMQTAAGFGPKAGAPDQVFNTRPGGR